MIREISLPLIQFVFYLPVYQSKVGNRDQASSFRLSKEGWLFHVIKVYHPFYWAMALIKVPANYDVMVGVVRKKLLRPLLQQSKPLPVISTVSVDIYHK